MEKVCVFKGLDGSFYTTEEKCKKANLKFKIEGIERKLDRFSYDVSEKLWKTYHETAERVVATNIIDKEAKILVTNVILQNSDAFLEIIAEKKGLIKELNALQKELDYKDKWWMKIKWW
jgi:hypothetical protein